MPRFLRVLLIGLAALMLVLVITLAIYQQSKFPQRSGELALPGLTAPVSVRYDEAGVPHLQAANEADLYRALGYVHAQDRLFQMEMLRRLARGELAEVLGSRLLPTDRLMRTLTLGRRAEQMAARMDPADPATRALQAYLAGVNQFVDQGPAPVEFDLLGMPRRHFTPADSFAVMGYLAYNFANTFRTEPVYTRIRDLGPRYAALIAPEDPAASSAAAAGGVRLDAPGQRMLEQVATLGLDAAALAAQPLLEGSNAWVVSGSRSRSGKPVLAGDPHIGFAVPAVWYEAHLRAPGFELYGHFNALIPMALLGHNRDFAWSLTMFQNDDADLIAERVPEGTPAEGPVSQVWHRGGWVALEERVEEIRVKGQPAERLVLRRSPHGPIVNDALPAGSQARAGRPLALWWAWLETDNPLLQAFYRLNRADTLPKAREAASMVHAPGVNIVWANAAGDIAAWSAARLPQRPPGVVPHFILDGASAEADKPGWLPFAANPQLENPAGGLIVSANQAPAGAAQPVPGYYAPDDRARWLTRALADPARRWDAASMQRLQLATVSESAPQILRLMLASLGPVERRPADEQALLRDLAGWQGTHDTDLVAPTLYQQWTYELLRGAMRDELGDPAFELMLRTRRIEENLLRLLRDPSSPWWDRRDTPTLAESREAIVTAAWQAALAHLRATLGPDPAQWAWGQAHTLTHVHPLGRQKPLDGLFNVGPLAAPGGREVPNQYTFNIGPAPWRVTSGPSTRRVIDLAHPGQALGGGPVGQSGVWGDAHYADQAEAHVRGQPRLMQLDAPATLAGGLQLVPAAR